MDLEQVLLVRPAAGSGLEIVRDVVAAGGSGHLEAETHFALDTMDTPIAYVLVKIMDFKEVVNYGVLSIPALIVNSKLLSTGRIPKREQIVQ